MHGVAELAVEIEQTGLKLGRDKGLGQIDLAGAEIRRAVAVAADAPATLANQRLNHRVAGQRFPVGAGVEPLNGRGAGQGGQIAFFQIPAQQRRRIDQPGAGPFAAVEPGAEGRRPLAVVPNE